MPLTQAERDFCFHFYREESRHNDGGPVHHWNNESEIPHGSMIAFGYWGQRNNPAWLIEYSRTNLRSFGFPDLLRRSSSSGFGSSWTFTRR